MSMTTIAARNLAAREAAGLTVEDVSGETCIRGTLIRDIEADRFASSGAPVYARGHVRAIARAVGVVGRGRARGRRLGGPFVAGRLASVLRGCALVGPARRERGAHTVAVAASRRDGSDARLDEQCER